MPGLHQSVQAFAPAKINLTLHVTGRRSDGYHLLDSLVAFADVGDQLSVEPFKGFHVLAEGPEAADVPTDRSNLILRVAALFEPDTDVSFTLTKRLPVTSGIGGGSADAAAAFRALTVFHRNGGARPDLTALLALGADIPMCVASGAARVRGIGEDILHLHDMPHLPAVLVNPRQAVSTPAVFQAMTQRDNPPMPEHIPSFKDVRDLAAWLAAQRNDMEATAIELVPPIAEVKHALTSQNDCLLARMSGSGATCFGLFPDQAAATAAAGNIAKATPEWWVTAATLGSQTERARPQVS